MTFFEKLEETRSSTGSLLCIGLDTDMDKLPSHFDRQPESVFSFNKAIIDATVDLVCAYKPNSAFYEKLGSIGTQILEQTVEYIEDTYPTVPVILDSKRGDIGNTNNGYVSGSFNITRADAVTLHPTLGREAMQPFLDQKDKGVIILCRTSNPGAGEFQDLILDDGKPLYQRIARNVANDWNKNGNCLLVVGATYPDEIAEVRDIVGPDMYLLIPGVGAQGGDVERTVKAGGDKIIINSSRGIIYASGGEDFAEVAREVTSETRDQINQWR